MSHSEHMTSSFCDTTAIQPPIAVVLLGTQALKSLDIPVHSFDEVTAAGQASPVDAVPPQPEDTCTIMYTSGTTGQPKGVLLTHKALVSSVATVIVYLRDSANITVGPGQYFLSFLPLAHIFDRLAEDCFIAMGGAVGFWQGNVKMLVDDIAALKPTVFIAVPRVLDRIYNGILDKINSTGGIAKYLFHWGYKRKLYYMQQGYSQAQASPLFDRVVFSKIKSRLGGRVRVICSGGAPLAADVEEFLRVTMCTAVVQGYGMTETCCAAGCITIPDNWEQFHTCGPVLPGAELRLESVPDMGYDATKEVEPAGEVLLRGPQLFSVYYKQEEKTAEALDDEGWFHTGDIAVLTKGDGIKVIDRKKNMFKLSQGEYVAAEKLELAYQHAPAAEQVWVYGDSFKSSLVAVVVPKKDAVLDWAKSAGKQGSFEELCKDPAAVSWMLSQFKTVMKDHKLKGFEAIRALILEPEHFSIENGFLTPSFKFKRQQLQKHYQAQIDQLYVKLTADERAAAQAQDRAQAAASSTRA
eukprot:GHUV01015380.1.p1 GENE.GHUV01015380.1~~GHUV01015380.1.p1  ORF type:complete len:524 (+),score=162.60 GHUV01015380.1:1230-2801(+)